MGNVGWTELLLIFLVILLVFGAKRIPEIARGLGRGIREFKDATTDIKRELTVGDQNVPPPAGQARYAQPGALPDQQGYQPAPTVAAPPAAAPVQQPAPSSAAPPEGEG